MRLTWHVYEKLRQIDLTAAEFELLVGEAELVEESWPEPHVRHEPLLLVNWVRPLHLAVIVDVD